MPCACPSPSRPFLGSPGSPTARWRLTALLPPLLLPLQPCPKSCTGPWWTPLGRASRLRSARATRSGCLRRWVGGWGGGGGAVRLQEPGWAAHVCTPGQRGPARPLCPASCGPACSTVWEPAPQRRFPLHSRSATWRTPPRHPCRRRRGGGRTGAPPTSRSPASFGMAGSAWRSASRLSPRCAALRCAGLGCAALGMPRCVVQGPVHALRMHAAPAALPALPPLLLTPAPPPPRRPRRSTSVSVRTGCAPTSLPGWSSASPG